MEVFEILKCMNYFQVSLIPAIINNIFNTSEGSPASLLQKAWLYLNGTNNNVVLTRNLL